MWRECTVSETAALRIRSRSAPVGRTILSVHTNDDRCGHDLFVIGAAFFPCYVLRLSLSDSEPTTTCVKSNQCPIKVQGIIKLVGKNYWRWCRGSLDKGNGTHADSLSAMTRKYVNSSILYFFTKLIAVQQRRHCRLY